MAGEQDIEVIRKKRGGRAKYVSNRFVLFPNESTRFSK